MEPPSLRWQTKGCSFHCGAGRKGPSGAAAVATPMHWMPPEPMARRVVKYMT